MSPYLSPYLSPRIYPLLAEFRLEQGRRLDDAEVTALLAELTQRNDLFRSAWDQQLVVEREGGLRTFTHPVRGLLCFEQVAFNLASRPELKLVILVEARNFPTQPGPQEGNT